ncbi:hypothetical protein NPIL_636051 [Nephila pilipes]|uniref:Uncharacterized protein n=1 Tax=Nephila pilipes TaxID=299642 RepID=A0A8X6TTL1_NEPPI|nr:hypothetical protein NPIL_636051 [Nephila pilipes]
MNQCGSLPFSLRPDRRVHKISWDGPALRNLPSPPSCPPDHLREPISRSEVSWRKPSLILSVLVLVICFRLKRRFFHLCCSQVSRRRPFIPHLYLLILWIPLKPNRFPPDRSGPEIIMILYNLWSYFPTFRSCKPDSGNHLIVKSVLKSELKRP